MASLRVVNKLGEVVGDGVTPEKFLSFKKQQGKGCAVLVELSCGEELLLDTVKLFRRLPPDAAYKARLLKRVARPPKNLDGAGHDVWVAV